MAEIYQNDIKWQAAHGVRVTRRDAYAARSVQRNVVATFVLPLRSHRHSPPGIAALLYLYLHGCAAAAQARHVPGWKVTSKSEEYSIFSKGEGRNQAINMARNLSINMVR